MYTQMMLVQIRLNLDHLHYHGNLVTQEELVRQINFTTPANEAYVIETGHALPIYSESGIFARLLSEINAIMCYCITSDSLRRIAACNLA